MVNLLMGIIKPGILLSSVHKRFISKRVSQGTKCHMSETEHIDLALVATAQSHLVSDGYPLDQCGNNRGSMV